MLHSARFPFVEVRQHARTFMLTSLPVKLLANVSYASQRGVDQESGAVQRVLNPRRISSIKDFTLKGGQFPVCIVLNWIQLGHRLVRSGSTVEVPDVPHSAQLIDGQHRMAGLHAAMEQRADIGELQIPTVIYENLSTKECAEIFLSINTEQKPVPRSLVFDLYGIVDETIFDRAATRARDIVMALNEDEDSPYFEMIKLPGSPRRRGGIALSTAISAIKPLTELKGDFEQRGIVELEIQKRIIINLFSAIKSKYHEKWDNPTNAFLYASGFVGAIEFLRTKLLAYGQRENDYTEAMSKSCLRLNSDDLILQEEVKGKGGKDAPNVILERLNSAFRPMTPLIAGIKV